MTIKEDKMKNPPSKTTIWSGSAKKNSSSRDK